jgi:hypothetical protein
MHNYNNLEEGGMSFDFKKIKECVMGCDYKKLCDIKNIKETLMSFDYKKIKYELNVSTMDQKIRYGVGILLVLISLREGKVILLLLGIALIATAYVKWCPAYSGFGKKTCGETADTTTASTGDESKEEPTDKA